MHLRLDPAWIVMVFLVSVRFGALFVLSPIFGSFRLPVQFRVLLVMALSAMMTFGRPASLPTIDLAPLAILVAAVSELAVGAVLAFGLFACFAVFQFAGKLLDVQMGFGIGNVFDPVTRAQSPMIGTLLNLVAVMLFFALDGHHLVIRGLAFSLEQIPPGGFFTDLSPAPVVAQFGVMFSLGLVLVAPVVFTLLLVDVGLGVMSRTMPQMNIFVLGIPVKIVVGLLMLFALSGHLGPVMGRAYQSVFVYWQRMLG